MPSSKAAFDAIHSAWLAMEQAEYRTSWKPASDYTAGKYVFTATNRLGETWRVTGDDPLAVVTELSNQLGLHVPV